MTQFSWLHLTDLHQGKKELENLWPEMENDFLDDLEKAHQWCGGIDLVLFTGDLTFGGEKAEFELFNNTLNKVWKRLEELGSRPCLLAVPGNHDLKRPSPDNALELEALSEWASRPSHQDAFWKGTGQLFPFVHETFAHYMQWWADQPFPRLPLHSGLLPGDFTATLEKEGVKLRDSRVEFHISPGAVWQLQEAVSSGFVAVPSGSGRKWRRLDQHS